MTVFSKDFIEKVKRSVSIKDLVSMYTSLTHGGSDIWIGRCPNPNHQDLAPSFRVWEKDNSWCCYGCHHGEKDSRGENPNYGSDTIAFLQWIEGFSWPQAVRYLADLSGIKIEEDKYSKEYMMQRIKAKSYHDNLSTAALNYLKERGLSEESIRLFMVGFNGSEITFPLINQHNLFVGFSNRQFLDENHPKYKNSKNSNIFIKKEYLYGSHLIDRSEKHIYITEGAMDVILPIQYGLKNIVSTLGTSFSEDHAHIIKRMGLTPVICMDGDRAGRESIEKMGNLLAAYGVRSKVLKLPEGHDMASLSNELKEGFVDYVEDNTIGFALYISQEILLNYQSDVLELNMKYTPRLVEAIQDVHEDEQKAIKDMVYNISKIRL